MLRRVSRQPVDHVHSWNDSMEGTSTWCVASSIEIAPNPCARSLASMPATLSNHASSRAGGTSGTKLARSRSSDSQSSPAPNVENASVPPGTSVVA
ncbi:MAG TPA: hypothetical protein VFK62_04205 [Gaiellaceae bacterium]|nr:hypothetical protein [Gaiellaceae bacterium]